MAFMEFERFEENGEKFVRDTGNQYSLAGWNKGLLYKAWEKKGRPLGEGWQVSADELIEIYSDGTQDITTRLLGIDWNPGWKNGIGLIELLDVRAYTYGNESGGAAWTPLMLRMQDLLYLEDQDIARRDEILGSVKFQVGYAACGLNPEKSSLPARRKKTVRMVSNRQ